MLKNKKFAFYAIMLNIIGLLYMFFFTALQCDHLNILTPFLQSKYGWSDLKVTNPATAGSLISIIFFIVIGDLFFKYGVDV